MGKTVLHTASGDGESETLQLLLLCGQYDVNEACGSENFSWEHGVCWRETGREGRGRGGEEREREREREKEKAKRKEERVLLTLDLP